MDATAQAELVARGEVSAVELVEHALMRIERIDPQLGAVVHLDAEGARQRARHVGGGPFAGVPYLVKDLLAFPGQPCTFGSRLFASIGFVPDDPIPYATALDGSGLVALGKSATSELGLLGSTETWLHGVTKNPWNPSRSAGGSSGGAAAAVAAGLVPIAHASDGGGSVRIPAALNGVFGFKPSGDRGVAAVAQPNDFTFLTTDHCVSRTVRDSARWLAFTERTDEGAPLRAVGLVEPGPVDALRVGSCRRSLTGLDAPIGGARALDGAERLLADLGHRIEPTEPPARLGADVSLAFFTMAGAAVNQMARVMAGLLGRPVGEADLEPFTLELLEWYRALPDGALSEARTRLARAARAVLEWHASFDVIVSPVVGVATPTLGFLSPDLDRETLVSRTERFAGYTPGHNMARAPAMSVPLHMDTEGMPVGVQFAAMPGQDSRLLGLAYQLEEAAPWADRWPACATASI